MRARYESAGSSAFCCMRYKAFSAISVLEVLVPRNHPQSQQCAGWPSSHSWALLLGAVAAFEKLCLDIQAPVEWQAPGVSILAMLPATTQPFGPRCQQSQQMGWRSAPKWSVDWAPIQNCFLCHLLQATSDAGPLCWNAGSATNLKWWERQRPASPPRSFHPPCFPTTTVAANPHGTSGATPTTGFVLEPFPQLRTAMQVTAHDASRSGSPLTIFSCVYIYTHI